MLTKRHLLIGLIIICLGIGAGSWWYLESTNNDAEAELVLYGNVDIREVRLAFNASEHVGEILVEEGNQV